MSNALLEAMCLGLPCISTKVSGAIDLIDNGENGLLVDIGDEQGLVRAMITIAEDKELQYMLGNNATKISEILNVSVVAKKWTDYLDSQITA